MKTEFNNLKNEIWSIMNETFGVIRLHYYMVKGSATIEEYDLRYHHGSPWVDALVNVGIYVRYKQSIGTHYINNMLSESHMGPTIKQSSMLTCKCMVTFFDIMKNLRMYNLVYKRMVKLYVERKTWHPGFYDRSL
uniref:Uncharacterized protein n=1 Tax=Magallana gigas TaxID=29159 RepID=K1PPB7_MAGGI